MAWAIYRTHPLDAITCPTNTGAKAMTSYTIKMADMPDEVELSDDWLNEIIRSSVARIEYDKEELRLLHQIDGLIAENDRLRGALKLFADEADRTGVEFVKHAQKWKRETIHLSSPTQKYIHPSYARIIGLGLSVVPLILDDLRKQGGDWFYALRAITGENPVKTSMAGDMPKMTRAWLLWGAKRNTQNVSQEPKP